MHRLFFRLFALAALYVMAGCTATRPPQGPTLPPVAQPPAAVPAPASAPAAAAPTAETLQMAPGAAPHIALLLPLDSPTLLGRASTVVEQGFLAANNAQPGALPVRIYACSNEPKEIVALYKRALAHGAKAVVGPLTPAGVSALLAHGDITVPTLALNRIQSAAPKNLYYFGLKMEDEARQAARVASMSQLTGAIIISTDTPLSHRLAAAFADEWKNHGGAIVASRTFNGDTTIFKDLPVEPGDMVFIAANAQSARIFRPFLDAMLPVYSTSQVFEGNDDKLVNYDLRDIVFFDMPWVLQQDRAVVQRYKRSAQPLPIDMERLYALGIDSYRLIRVLLDNRQGSPVPFEGVTGMIQLAPNHTFMHEGVMAEFHDGMGMTSEAEHDNKARERAMAASRPVAVDPLQQDQ